MSDFYAPSGHLMKRLHDTAIYYHPSFAKSSNVLSKKYKGRMVCNFAVSGFSYGIASESNFQETSTVKRECLSKLSSRTCKTCPLI